MSSFHVAPAQVAASPADADLALGAEGRVWEGIVTTRNADGTTNIAPMGPIAGPSFQRLLLRPFQSSQTHGNLRRDAVGVFHLTDDAELIARAAIADWDSLPRLLAIAGFPVPRLANCTRWFAFEVEQFDETSPRASALARVVDQGAAAVPTGFNRAKAAVVEAAILATRVGLIDPSELQSDLRRLAIAVKKTGAAAELRAFSLLTDYVNQRLGAEQEDRAR